MKRVLAAVLAALSLAACGGPSRDQRDADAMTRAVINNDMRPVMKDIDPSLEGQITRIRVAELSDELNAQGAYKGLTDATKEAWCDKTRYTGCYVANFANRPYQEVIKLGSDGKIQYWWTHAAPQTQTQTQ